MFRRIKQILAELGARLKGANREKRSVSKWFSVRFDDKIVTLEARPPGREPWTDQFRWADIERICFKSEDFMTSDGIYVFTSRRAESFAIPMEADGGQAFWREVLDRNLFDSVMAIAAMGAVEGVFCWPPPKAGDETNPQS